MRAAVLFLGITWLQGAIERGGRACGGAGEDAALLSVVGVGVCRLFRLEAGAALKPVPLPALAKREGQAHYTAHAWLVDNDARETLVGAGRYTLFLWQSS